jgi:paraquat-inducible protein B
VTARARPRLVGAFVLVAVGLALAGIAALSSGRLFAEHRTYVVFFPNAVGGLKEGAPVTLRQVPVGQVKDVELVFAGTGYQDSRIKVLIQVRRGGLRNVARQESALRLSDAELARILVDAGLRAAVRSSSPVAGQKSVDLDFHPELAPRLSGIETPYPEIPTAPTGMELLGEKLEATLEKISDVPIDEVLLQLKATLASAQQLLDSGDVHGALRELRQTLEAANRTLASAEKTMGNVDGLVTDARATMSTVNDTVKGLGTTLERLNQTLATVDRNVERTADVQLEGAKTLDEMTELLKNLRFLVDTLQRHPEALLQGKPQTEEKK